MDRPGLANRRELASWADSVVAQTEFPRLIRRLIFETVPGLVYLGIPAGEGVASGGWDGTVRASSVTAFVPDGLSLWELSVERSVGTKANKDYAKRDSTPDGSPPAECTYVAAILRPWTERATWARERSAEGKWREARAYGLDDIETWLETAPVTWAWISERLGFHPYGLQPAESWWNAWTSQTNPAVSGGLVLAGRAVEANLLRDRLAGTPQVTTIAGPSVEEVRAFIAAVGIRADGEGMGQLLARMAFVDEMTAWRSLMERRHSLVLVPTVGAWAREAPAASPHHIIVPVASGADADIKLPTIDASEAASALREGGMSDERRADEAGRLARRSLIALRRHIAIKPELHEPMWASPPVNRSIRGMSIAGSWSEGKDGDQQILSELSGESYDDLRETIDGLAHAEDPYIARVDASWSLVSAYDAWLLLGRHLRADDLERLESVVDKVLGERDPALDLPEDQQWMANALGKERAFTADLRFGLARSLALLGVLEQPSRGPRGSNGASWASYLVGKLLKQANEDSSGERWASISDLLPLLAEAGPDSFIDAVRDGVGGDDPLLAKIFVDSPSRGHTWGRSPHTGLLWALENLAWSLAHFGSAVDLLARLDALDPGGQLANRPFASLKSIFCPWHPETTAVPSSRLAALDGLRSRHPTTAWRLMLSILPEFHAINMPTHEPQYRDWKRPHEPVNMAEYSAFVSEVVTRILSDAASSSERWKEVLDHLAALPPLDRGRIIAALETRTVAEEELIDDTTLLWQALTQTISHHQEFSNAQWALPDEELRRLADVSLRIVPASSYPRFIYLFADYTPPVDGADLQSDYAAYEAKLVAARKEAIAEIEAEGGLDLVRRLAAEATVPGIVGFALASAVGDKYDEQLLPLLMADQSRDLDLAYSYFAGRFVAGQWTWLTQFLAQHAGLSEVQQARLLLSTHDFPKAWEVAESRGASVAEAYWKHFHIYGLGAGFQFVGLVAAHLMAVGRNAAALHLVTTYRFQNAGDEAATATIVVKGLKSLLEADTTDGELHLLSHDFRELFKFLERHRSLVSEDRLAALEWAFLPALGFDADAPMLHRQMARDPSFFVEVISTVFRRRSMTEQVEVESVIEGEFEEDETEPDADSEQVGRAENGYRLLSSWRQSPGISEEGILDHSLLREWVERALVLLKEADRFEVGQQFIGKVLVSIPAEVGGPWPPEAVRDLLEELQSRDVETGIRLEIVNRRGVTTRSPEDGGAQERALAEKYRTDADRFADQWPRTAAIFLILADSYEAEGRRNDEEAERVRRGMRG